MQVRRICEVGEQRSRTADSEVSNALAEGKSMGLIEGAQTGKVTSKPKLFSACSDNPRVRPATALEFSCSRLRNRGISHVAAIDLNNGPKGYRPRQRKPPAEGSVSGTFSDLCLPNAPQPTQGRRCDNFVWPDWDLRSRQLPRLQFPTCTELCSIPRPLFALLTTGPTRCWFV